MSGTNDEREVDNGARRGLFRRGRRSDAVADSADIRTSNADAVATIDELARRMELLVASNGAIADDPVRAEFEMQRAVIARANDLAATTTSVEAPATMHDDIDAPQAHPATEDPVQQQPTTQDTTPDTDDIEARLDAALQPVQAVTPSSDTVTLDPTPVVVPDVPQMDAVLAPTTSDVVPGNDAAVRLGIDVDRVVRAIEDEALAVQRRIDLEMNHAHLRAEEIVDRAEAEAERIREHGQAQARVLLGEVEEIISEAQQTGEQILHRANEEAATMRADATGVLQQAQGEARTIVETARREGEQVLAEQRRLATVRAQEAMREQERLKDQIRRLEERRRQVLESLEPLISQLTQMMPAGTQAPASATPQNVVQLQRQQQPAKA